MSEQSSVEFVGGRVRSEEVVLDCPFRYKPNGKLYEKLVVRRLTAKQVADWVEAVKSRDPEADLGNVVDVDGQPVPRAVIDALDDDDDLKLSEGINRFLPQRLSETLGPDSATQTT